MLILCISMGLSMAFPCCRGIVGPEVVDDINILQAAMLAMANAVRCLPTQPSPQRCFHIFDGNRLPMVRSHIISTYTIRANVLFAAHAHLTGHQQKLVAFMWSCQHSRLPRNRHGKVRLPSHEGGYKRQLSYWLIMTHDCESDSLCRGLPLPTANS